MTEHNIFTELFVGSEIYLLVFKVIKDHCCPRTFDVTVRNNAELDLQTFDRIFKYFMKLFQ